MSENEIHFRCPWCTSRLKAPAQAAGKKLNCIYCYKEVVVPNESSRPLSEADSAKLYAVDLAPSDLNEQKHRFEFLEYPCPLCRTIIAVKPEDIGKTIECPDCGTKVVIPESIRDQKRKPAEKPSPQYAPELKTSDVYGIDGSELKAPLRDEQGRVVELRGDDRKAAPNEIAVYCPLCETLQYTTRDKIGQKIKCQECDREFVVRQRSDDSNPKKSEQPLSYEGSSVYGLEGSTSASSEQKNIASDPAKNPELVEVVCKLCGTIMYVPRSMIGQKKKCPDCYTETVVIDKSEEKKKREETIQPVFTGGYEVGPAERPTVYSQYGVKKEEPKEDIYATKEVPLPPVSPVVSQPVPNVTPQVQHVPVPGVVASPVTSGKESQNGNKSVPVPKKKKKVKRKKKEVMPGGVTTKQVGDTVVMVTPRPPRFAMVNGIFGTFNSLELWSRAILVMAINTGIFALLLIGVFPLFTKTDDGGIENAAILVPLLALSGLLAACSLRSLALSFIAIFMYNSTASGPVLDWPEEDFVGGILQAFGLTGVGLLAVGPAIILRIALGTVIAGYTLPLGIMCFIIIFPIVFLSFMQNGFIFTSSIFMSLFRCCGTWLIFYLMTFLLVGLPVFGWLMIPPGLTYALIGTIVLALTPLMFAMLVARLAWVIADDIKYGQDDDDADLYS